MIPKRQNIGFTKGSMLRHLKQPKQIPPSNMLRQNTRINRISDAEGLRLAYQQPNHIYIKDNRMYIAGSKSPKDWVDNVAFIPTKLTPFHNIYQSANSELQSNPQVDELVGHSAGGSVLLELEKQYPNRFQKSRSYAAPVLSPFGNEKLDDNHLRFRTAFDPVAILDNSAITVKKPSINPFKTHSYENFGDMGKETGVQIM